MMPITFFSAMLRVRYVYTVQKKPTFVFLQNS